MAPALVAAGSFVYPRPRWSFFFPGAKSDGPKRGGAHRLREKRGTESAVGEKSGRETTLRSLRIRNYGHPRPE